MDAKWGEPPLSDAAVRRGVWIFLGLGLLARAVRYFLNFPLWEDECFLVHNYIRKGYGDLLGALEPHQAAPVLYLWLQLTAVKLLGFTEMALRSTAFLASVASLFVFAAIARRLLSGTSLLLAIALFSVSYPCIRYCAEAKQYGTDLLVGAVFTLLVVAWLQDKDRLRPLWILAALAPFAVGLSYPAAFLGGGISLAIAYVLWRDRPRAGWAPWIAFNVALCGSFLVVVVVAAKHQTAAELEFMRSYWHFAFLPKEPLEAVAWVVKIHTGSMFGYPAGNGPGGGLFGFAMFVVGLIALSRRGRRSLLVLALAPLALQFVAGALRRYPYGGHIKFMVHMAPIFCLVGGLGAGAALAQLRGRARRGTRILLVIFALVGAGTVVRDVALPFKTRSDEHARAFARWFWPSAAHGAEAVDLKTDLGLTFSAKEDTELSWLYTYLVNMHIYRERPPRLENVAKDHPVRFLRYRVGGFSYDEERFRAWLDETKRRYEIVGRDTYPFPRYSQRGRNLVTVDHLDIYTCIPRN